MTIFLRILRLLSISTWVGSLIFFAYAVARVAFSVSPDPHTAGAFVRGTLVALHHLGLAAGALYFLLTVVLLMSQRDTHPARALELALVVAMLALTAYSQFSVLSRMERDRNALGGDTTRAMQQDPGNPTLQHFQRLHGLSVKLEIAVLLEGLFLLALAPIHGRDDEYRYTA